MYQSKLVFERLIKKVVKVKTKEIFSLPRHCCVLLFCFQDAYSFFSPLSCLVLSLSLSLDNEKTKKTKDWLRTRSALRNRVLVLRYKSGCNSCKKKSSQDK
jgi:hypothetical protein